MARCNKCGIKISEVSGCLCTPNGATIGIIPDIQPHYNRGLGMFINSRRQYNAELKERNLIEVGNEKNYVSPAYNQKLQEQKESKVYSELKEKALNMLNRSDPIWN